MANILDLLKKLRLGAGDSPLAAGRGAEMSNPHNAGMPAPSPHEMPGASDAPNAPAGGWLERIKTAQPVATAPAMPGLQIAPQQTNRRDAMRSSAAEWQQRTKDMAMDAPPEVVFKQPFGEERFNAVTKGGTEDPRGRGGLRGFLESIGTGAYQGMQTGGVEGGLGGALGGALRRWIDPAGAKEEVFNVNQLPQLMAERQMQNEERGWLAKYMASMAQAQRAQAQASAAQDGADLKREQFEFEKTRNRFGTPQMISGPDGKEHLVVYDTNDPTRTIDLGIAGQPQTQKLLEELRQRGQNARTVAGIESREKIAAQSSRDRRDIAAAYEGGRNARHEGGGGQAGSGANLYQEWATLRKKAMNEDGRLTQQEVDAAVMQMNEAAEKLRNDPSFKVGGDGGWSWVEPVRGGASPQGGGGGRKISMRQLQQHGLSKEAAEKAGYTVVE